MSRPGLPKLIATDLDGTVVRPDGTVSDRTIAAFDRVAAAGIPIAGVTGRGPRLLDLSRQDLPQASYFVLGQGSQVIDVANPDVPMHAVAMDGTLVLDVLARLESTTGPLSVMVEPLNAPDNFLWGDRDPAWPYADSVHPYLRADALAVPVLKVFMRSAALDVDDLLVAARALIEPEAVEFTQAGLGYVEICPPGVTKGTGLAVVAEHLGVDPADILTFGDMPNDVPMFRYAGWRRVAVAGAHPELCTVADEIIGDCTEDAVAIYLESLLDQEPQAHLS